TVSGTAPFDVGINSTLAGIDYRGYQVELQFQNAALDPTGTSTYNASSPFQLCQGAPNTLTSGDGAIEFVQDSCAKSTAGSVAYMGQLERMQLVCKADGDFVVHMTPLAEDSAFGTTMLDATSSPIPTQTAAATISCTGIGITLPTATGTVTPMVPPSTT